MDVVGRWVTYENQLRTFTIGIIADQLRIPIFKNKKNKSSGNDNSE
jgi:hypothetical protein